MMWQISSLICCFLVAVEGYYFRTFETGNPYCPQVEGTFANPYDCTTFVTCAFGVGCIMDCPKGLRFNAKEKVCDYAINTPCTTTQPTGLSNLYKCSDKRHLSQLLPVGPVVDGNETPQEDPLVPPGVVIPGEVVPGEVVPGEVVPPAPLPPCVYLDDNDSGDCIPTETLLEDLLNWNNWLNWFNKNRHTVPAVGFLEGSGEYRRNNPRFRSANPYNIGNYYTNHIRAPYFK